jgi:malonyl-CoA O-methyltransferase
MRISPDPLRTRFNRSRNASALSLQSQLPQEVGIRMLDHLEGLRVEVKRLLYLGAGSGWLKDALHALFPDADILFTDECVPLIKAIPSSSWLTKLSRFSWLTGKATDHRLACSIERLPFNNGSFDLVVAHGVLPWCDPQLAFTEARRVLRQDGLMLFSSLGPDTYKEWRGAGSSHMLSLIDMHDLADLASHAGLTSPVVDMEYLTVFYPDIQAIVQDLRTLGGGNGIVERPRGLMTPRAYQKLVSAIERTRTPEGLPQTLELIYGHAWNTRPLVTSSGRPVIPILTA